MIGSLVFSGLYYRIPAVMPRTLDVVHFRGVGMHQGNKGAVDWSMNQHVTTYEPFFSLTEPRAGS